MKRERRSAIKLCIKNGRGGVKGSRVQNPLPNYAKDYNKIVRALKLSEPSWRTAIRNTVTLDIYILN